MGVWYAKLELNGEYMEVHAQAGSKGEAIALAQRENQVFADEFNRPLYVLTELRRLDKPRLRDRLRRRG